MFRAITEEAGLGTGWVPREMGHTFVSLLSARGVPVEAIALLAGHNQASTTELVDRKSRVLHQTEEKRQVSRLRRYGIAFLAFG
jgi:integrase